MKTENIKFKAKRLDNGEWIVGSIIRSTAGVKERAYIVDNFSSMSDYSVVGVDPSTVCMFTGLTDKNGAPIYEGDIVMHKDNNAERRGDINWYSKAAAFYFGQDFLVHYHSEDMVVVGNKFNK